MMEPKRLAFRATAYLTTSAIGEARSRPCQGGRLAGMDDRNQVGFEPHLCTKVGRRPLVDEIRSARAWALAPTFRSLAQYCPYRPLTESNSFRESYPIPSLKTISTLSMSEICFDGSPLITTRSAFFPAATEPISLSLPR